MRYETCIRNTLILTWYKLLHTVLVYLMSNMRNHLSLNMDGTLYVVQSVHQSPLLFRIQISAPHLGICLFGLNAVDELPNSLEYTVLIFVPSLQIWNMTLYHSTFNFDTIAVPQWSFKSQNKSQRG